MLKGIGLAKKYGDLHVLKGVDVSIEESEIVAVVGASGAGKSTLLHILGTLDQPDVGTLQLVGQEMSNLSVAPLARFRNSHLGFIFQFHNLLPEFTALENVCLPGFLSNASDKEVKSRAVELLERLGLVDRMNHKPAELSGGEQQRTSVARALINNPEIVFADEPSGNLDSKTAHELHQLFFDLRDEFKKTFVIVTHNEALADLADRKLVMADGVLIN